MRWKVVLLQLLFAETCFGQTTTPSSPSYVCDTSPTDNYCYCILDSTADTNNWFVARSYCRKHLDGDLADLSTVAELTFIEPLMNTASTANVWLGVTDIEMEATYRKLLNPNVTVIYDPIGGAPPNVDSSKNCVVHTPLAWENVKCQDNATTHSTMCRIQNVDAFGYDELTGCPSNAIRFGDSCFGVYTISNNDTREQYGNAKLFCKLLSPPGQLVIPRSIATNDFVQKLALQTEIDTFWLQMARTNDDRFYTVGGPLLTYFNWEIGDPIDQFEPLRPVTKYAMSAATGKWISLLQAEEHGVICEFDAAPLPTNQPTVPSATSSTPCSPSYTAQTNTAPSTSTGASTTGKITTDDQETIVAKTTMLQSTAAPVTVTKATIEKSLDMIRANLAASTDDTVLHDTEAWLLDHTTIPDDVADPSNYVQKYLSACSDIMNDTNAEYWKAKPGGASDMVEACSSVVEDLAKSSDTDHTITTSNLVATTKVYPRASGFEDLTITTTINSQVVITKEDFDKLGIPDDKKITTSITSYTNGKQISDRSSETDGGDAGYPVSGVISITMFVENVKTSIPVSFTLTIDQENVMNAAEGKEPTCVHQKTYANGDIAWDSTGCQNTKSINSTVTCSCEHTTNFAVLMQVKNVKISKKDELALDWITYVCCGLSIICLLMTLVVLLALRSLLRSDRVTIHVNLVIALIWAQTLLLLATPAAATEALCRAVAIMLHYFFLAVFCWMLVEGVHLYLQIVRVFSAGKDRLIPYLLVGWGSPILIVVITAGVRWDEYGDNGRCWLSTAYGMIWAFVGPALLIIAINFVILIMVLRILIISAKSKSEGEYDHVKAGIKGAVLLLPLLGITWLFGIISISADTVVFLYLFSIFNSLQGVFIFVIYIVFNGEVRNAILRRKEKRALTRGDFTSTVDSTSDSKGKQKLNRVHPDSETKETQMVDIKSTTTTHTHTQMTFRNKSDEQHGTSKMDGSISTVD